MELFRVRLNCVDHYQAQPTPYDPQLRRNVSPSQMQNEPKVPVIRVFGSTETGQKVCAHIHGAFPYLYIKYPGPLHSDDVGTYIYQLHLSIDHALGVSYRRNVYDGRNQYVARISLVKGVPFYGYYVGYQYFLKIYMFNPMTMTRLSDLLRQGVIMKKIFQPYEAHLQYILQWMTDYNLYGCGYIDCGKAYFRSPVPKYDELENICHLWHDRSIPPEFILRESILPRASHCSVEVDICVQDILNRKEIRARPLHHDFIEHLNTPAPDEKLVHSMAGLWRDETRRRKSKMVDSDPASSPFPPEVMISMSADSRSSQKVGWIHEDEYREKIKDLILEERGKIERRDLSLETFINPHRFEDSVKTALEAVEDLHPGTLGPLLGLSRENLADRIDQKDKNEDFNAHLNKVDSRNILNSSDESSCSSEEDVSQDIDIPQRDRQNDFIETHSQPNNAPEFDDISNKFHTGGLNHTCSHDDLLKPTVGGLYQKLADIDQISKDDPPSGGEHDPESIETTRLQNGSTGYLPPLSSNSSSKVLGVKRTSSHVPLYKKRQRFDDQRGDSSSSAPMNTEWTDESEGNQLSRRGTANSFNKLVQTFTPYTETVAISASTIMNSDSPLFTTTTPHRAIFQDTLKSTGNVTARFPGFPVVKDPQEPSTVLRLSQGSSSEKSGTKSPEKHVSFDPPIEPSTERNSSSSLWSANPDPLPSIQTKVMYKVLENMICFDFSHANSRLLGYREVPPTVEDVNSTMAGFGLPPVIYQDAFYSNELDVPERVREWAGREFKLESLTVPFLPSFDATGSSPAGLGEKPSIVRDKYKEEAVSRKQRRVCGIRSWEIAEPPPTSTELLDWLHREISHECASPVKDTPTEIMNNTFSQIDGPTQKSRYGLNYTQQHKSTVAQYEAQYMSTMSLEVHINTRGKFMPNPEEDEVQCIFWCLQTDQEDYNSNGIALGSQVGIVVLSEDGNTASNIRREMSVNVHEEVSELDLLVRMVEIVRTYDPDILTGYEVHSSSWGYLIERARLKYDYNLCDEFSRMRSQSHGRFGKENDKWGFNNTSTIRVTGRHMINIWRAMRSEINLLQYTMENVAYHLLQRRIPHYSWPDLTFWYSNGRSRDLAKVLKYYVSRVQVDLEILERNELIPRTSEQARLLGVDFFSVFSRGSQFKVESLMFRIAKPENFILVSPSRKQVGSQNALECLPLVMEPQSAFYNSPLLVLDFQSLYPSVMIAYNYCYSTFLGRIVDWRGTNKMGFAEYKRQDRLLELLQDHINIAPNGMMYVKPTIRKSLLAKMLGEILETRVMVKSGMKTDKDDNPLQMLLNNRQLALKLIANVTYGYTSASFSGRMPCSEIADSIVQTSRETLEKAIALIHSVKRWGAEVVYGDTDSLFVYLKGRTKDQAFEIGDEIAKMVTNINPRPVKLKFEKVYFPCVLIAKKRYVGFKYETRDQKEPEFDAKGIETVRRDGTPAEQKIEEKALRLLFQSADLSQVKQYFQKQCEKIMKGSVSIQDFCFAKEVKLGTYSEKGLPPPGALISTRRMLEDARSEPQYGERIPYVVITGAPSTRLIDRCVSPETLLDNDHLELDAEYYISKNLIPPLERIFNLVGANVRSWYDEMPKFQRIRRIDTNVRALMGSNGQPIPQQRTIESFMKSSSCVVCREKLESDEYICAKCSANRSLSLFKLQTRLSRVEKKSQDFEKVCQSCSGIPCSEEVKCDSKDCPVFYSRTKQRRLLKTEKAVVGPIMKVLQGKNIAVSALNW